jgi:hypothetical protein
MVGIHLKPAANIVRQYGEQFRATLARSSPRKTRRRPDRGPTLL